MNQPPAFQFYPDNFRDGCADMEQSEIGAYMLLLCYQWGHGSIPSEKARMERAAYGPVSDHVLKKFRLCEDGQLRNERMEKEREKQVKYREKQSEYGKNGGRPKKGSENGSLSKPFSESKGSENGSQSPPSPSPSPSPSPISNTVTESNSEDSPPALSPKAAKVRRKAETETDDEWIAGLEKMDCFRLIPIRDELGLAQAWCSAHSRQCTRQFFNRWLLRSVEKARTISTNGTNLHSQKSEKYGF